MRIVGDTTVLFLTNSKMAIQVVQKVGKRGIDRTRGLVEVIKRLAAIEEVHGKGSVTLALVKPHVGIVGNENKRNWPQRREMVQR